MSDDNVVYLDVGPGQSIPPERVIEAAKEYQENGTLKHCIIVGRTVDGELYYASSIGDVPEIVYLLESMKHYIMSNTSD